MSLGLLGSLVPSYNRTLRRALVMLLGRGGCLKRPARRSLAVAKEECHSLPQLTHAFGDLLLLCCSIHDYQSQLKALGQDVTGNRGKMLHLILTICQKVEKAFNKIVEGGEGGEQAKGKTRRTSRLVHVDLHTHAVAFYGSKRAWQSHPPWSVGLMT